MSIVWGHTESGLKLPGLDLASLATQGVCAGAQPNAYTGYGIFLFSGTSCRIADIMTYLLPCKCGQSVEVEPGQAGQTVKCDCGENLLVPSMLQVKALPVAPEKPKPLQKRNSVPYRAALVNLTLGMVSLILLLLFRGGMTVFLHAALLYVLFRGLTCAFLCTAAAFAIRDWAKSPLAEDSTLRRTFFVLGIAFLFPAFLLASYLYMWQPHPIWVSFKQVYFSHGSYQRHLYQNSTPISPAEHRILRMTDEQIDRMNPMDLYFYFQTLQEPTFSYNFQDNYEGIKDTYRIWVTGDIILLILAFLSIIASFFMPRQTVEVAGWSGNDWR